MLNKIIRFFKQLMWKYKVKKLTKVATTMIQQVMKKEYVHWRDWNDCGSWFPYKEGIRSAPRYALHYVHKGHIHRKAA